MKLPLALASLLLTALPAAQATTSFAGALAPEAPGATGTGTVLIEYDDAANTLAIDALWFGLSGLTTVAHIHCCTAAPGTGTIGVAVTPGTLPGFPVGVSFGKYSTVLDLGSIATYTAGFLGGAGGTVEGAEAKLITGFLDGTAYFNVHSDAFPGGEIRSFIAVVPEPASWAMMGLGLAALGGWARRRQASA